MCVYVRYVLFLIWTHCLDAGSVVIAFQIIFEPFSYMFVILSFEEFEGFYLLHWKSFNFMNENIFSQLLFIWFHLDQLPGFRQNSIGENLTTVGMEYFVLCVYVYNVYIVTTHS